MELEYIIVLVTMVVTWILGIVSKKCTFISNNLIPVQNLLVGLIVAIIEYIITKDFNVAIATSGLLAGGIYDIKNNAQKLIKGAENGNK